MQRKIVPINRIRPRENGSYFFVFVYRRKRSPLIWTPKKKKRTPSTAFGLVVAAPGKWVLDIPKSDMFPDDAVDYDRYLTIPFPVKVGDWVVFDTGFGTIINPEMERIDEGSRPELRCLDLRHTKVDAVFDEFLPEEMIEGYEEYKGV